MDNLRRTMLVDLEDEIDYSKLYFTIELLEDGNVGFGGTFNGAGVLPTNVLYSFDGINWTQYELSFSDVDSTNRTIRKLLITNGHAGDKVYIKMSCPEWVYFYSSSTNDYLLFYITARAKVYGNILSLVYSDNYTRYTNISRGRWNFALIFNNQPIVDASNLILPGNVASNGKNMSGCYEAMFNGCNLLEKAPELPAVELNYHCYHRMFSGCTSLKYIKCLASTFKYNCTEYWLNMASDTGTFVKSADANNWPRSTNGIPAGWTVIDA